MDADGLLAGLDDEQRQAVVSTSQPLCILAGAGSGKTRVLTRRIAHRVATGASDPRKVLALTFTRKAAGELKERLGALGMRDQPTAGTFHAVAYAQLRTAWASANQRPPVLLERKGAFLGRLLPRGGALRAGDLAAEIEWAKARLVPPDAYPAAAAQAGRRPPAELDAIARLYRRYEDEKRDRATIDFDDLLIRCLGAMTRDAAFRAAQRWRFRHLYVDEFQDVNPLQFRLLSAWLGDSIDLCVVGDPAQAIYRWNGADADYLIRFTDHFPTADVLELPSNYRSTPEILVAADRVLGRAAGMQRSPLRAHRPEGTRPEAHGHPTDLDEAAAVARAARDHHGPGHRWSSQAVLVRTNGQLPVLETAFRKANIPYRVRGGRTFAERPEVRDALQAARRADTQFSVWLADLESALGAAKDQLAPVTDAAHGDGAPSLEERLAAAEPGSAADRIAGLDQLARLGHEFNVLDPVAPAHAFPQWLNATVRGEDADHGDAVELVTFHAAKGLEWPVVHLAGLEQGFVPVVHATDDASVAEERRLLYVAVTRAADTVHATWAANRTFGTRTIDRQPSPWLRLLTGSATHASPTEASAAAPGSEPTPDSAPTRRRGAQRARAGIVDSRERLAAAIDNRPSLLRTDHDPGRRAAFDALWAWRGEAARKAAVPPAVVLADRVLDAIAQARPTTVDELAKVEGMTGLRAERHGDTLLAVLAGVRHPTPKSARR